MSGFLAWWQALFEAIINLFHKTKTVTITATLKDSAGNLVANQPITASYIKINTTKKVIIGSAQTNTKGIAIFKKAIALGTYIFTVVHPKTERYNSSQVSQQKTV